MSETGLAYGVSLLFTRGRRPDKDAVARLATECRTFSLTGLDNTTARAADGTTDAALNGHGANGEFAGHRRNDGSEDWLELLANGLTFDLCGLAPGHSAPSVQCVYPFDLQESFCASDYEAIWLVPGPHLAGGERMLPVVRAMVGVAAALCDAPGLAAIAWHPARSCIGPRYFTSVVGNWQEGGVFPGLGLVGLQTSADGAMQSEGMAFFTGQEIRIEPELAGDRTAAAKIAVRLIDYLVSAGQLREGMEVTGPNGQLLQLEPSANGRFIRVWSAS
ncbi:MAG: hypothetical protein KDE63_04305 [Novosphingobium sp.]|nr:hypothetical protein [Novosphingobium sp.]